jgi:hypothetical protein
MIEYFERERREQRDAIKRTLVVCAIGAAIYVAAWAALSAKEAEAYNRVTGANVSTWDAMFIDLRVVATPKAP